MPAVGGTGLALPLNVGLPVGGHVDVARQAEQLGYDRVWAAEAGTNDAFGLLTACASATKRIGLATGVVPIQTRTPSLMAQSAQTLHDASGGRFTLGFGVSSPVIVERWNGLTFDKPLARMREYVEIVRRLMSGEKVTYDGQHYRVQGYQLLMHARQPAPGIVIGALNEGMLRCAGELTDGALLNWIGVHAVPDALATIRSGGGETTNGVFVRVCVTDDIEAARRWAHREVMGYVIVPAYRRAFERHGWADACKVAMELWDGGERKGAAGSLPTEFVDSLCIAGDAAHVKAKFEEFRAAGADEPIAFLFTGQTEPEAVRAELTATLQALAPA